MKKSTQVVLLGVLFLNAITATAQISTSTGGAANVLANSPTTNTNVGIGNAAPSGKLDVIGNTGVVSLAANSTATANFRTSGTVQVAISTSSTAPFTTSLQAKHTTTSFNQAYPIALNPLGGNVGIGTADPKATLDVNGTVKATQGLFSKSLPTGSVFTDWMDRNEKCDVLTAGSIIGTGPGFVNTRMLNFFDFPQSNIDAKPTVFLGIEDRNNFGRYRFIAETGGNTQMIILNKSQQEVMKVYEDGNDNVTMTLPKANSFIGIGTTSFTDGMDTYRLSVKGAIRADRVKVYTTWADFVFEKNYKLPTLKDVENHIKKNGHLKDIPSAKEVEAKGIELGEMNKLLLQKVEELTLYMIEMNKEMQLLKEQIKK